MNMLTRMLATAFFCVASANFALAQGSQSCSEAQATQAARSDPAIGVLCGAGSGQGCDFVSRPPAFWSVSEKDDPNLGWVITATGARNSIAAEISKDCTVKAEKAEACSMESAVRVTQADPAVRVLCGQTVGDKNALCRFAISQPGSAEPDASGPKWLVTITSSGMGAKFKTTDTISQSCQVVEDIKSCTAEKAVEAARANPAVSRFCSQTLYGPLFKCEFKAGKSPLYPLGEQSDPGAGWLVSASTYRMGAFTKISPGCRVVSHPIFANAVELGTVEQGTAQATDIVIGKVVDVQGPEAVMQGGGAKIQSETVTVAVSTVLKGRQASRITFDNSFAWPKSSAKVQWLGDGRERLFFISKGTLVGNTDRQRCIIDIQNRDSGDAQAKALQACLEKADGGKPVLLGNWPNGIDLETGANSTLRPVFSQSGDVLKTRPAIVGAVQAELAAEAGKPSKQKAGDWEKKIDLPADKYAQAYAAGIPEGTVITLDVPEE